MSQVVSASFNGLSFSNSMNGALFTENGFAHPHLADDDSRLSQADQLAIQRALADEELTDDESFALALQASFLLPSDNYPSTSKPLEIYHNEVKTTSGHSESGSKKKHSEKAKGMSPVDPEWETIDPIPDIFALFNQFNQAYFWGTLGNVEVKWSKQMTSCAGICRYQSRAGYCTVSLSQPLLKFRPRKDLVETLLHEMIHAYLFVASNDRDRESHGENFHLHMHRINGETGAKISVYHSFHDEVRHYKTHVWRCNGPCQHEKPYLGFVRRARNRAPSVNDLWWEAHKAKCNGEFVKIGEPEGFKARKRKVVGEEEKVEFQESWNSKGHVLGSIVADKKPKPERPMLFDLGDSSRTKPPPSMALPTTNPIAANRVKTTLISPDKKKRQLDLDRFFPRKPQAVTSAKTATGNFPPEIITLEE